MAKGKVTTVRKEGDTRVRIPPILIKEFGGDVRVIIKDHSPYGLNPLGLKQLANTRLMRDLLKNGDIVFIPNG